MQREIVNTVSLPSGTWIPVQVSAPSILVVKNATDLSFPVTGFTIYYSPEKGQSDLVQVYTARGAEAVIYLPTPGTWYLYQADISTLEMLLIDSSGMGSPGNWFQDRGFTRWLTSSNAVTNAASVRIAQARRRRRYVIVHNIGAQDCYINWFKTTTGPQGIFLGTGRTNPLSRYECKDESIAWGDLTALCTSGAASTLVVCEGYN